MCANGSVTQAIEFEGEKNAVDRCLEIIQEGGCDLDKTYTGPKLEQVDGKYQITEQFIKEMIEWFKEGKTLPKRYVWEIVLGAHEHFAKEESLVEVKIPEGVTVDVIGDVHGESRCARFGIRALNKDFQDNSMTSFIFSRSQAHPTRSTTF